MSRGSAYSPCILGYGCVTAAGQGASPLFEGLRGGVDHSIAAAGARVCRIGGDRRGTTAERMAQQLMTAWGEAARGFTGAPRLGVIFASTKGCIDDTVWTGSPAALRHDTLEPVLRRFLALAGLSPVRALCVSNACSSTHVALHLAGIWLARAAASHVLVLAADHVGRFVLDGFASLKSLAGDRVTPFAAGRQGIQLGEAAVALLLGTGDGLHLRAVDTRVEGYALTRSHESGATLAAACTAACGDDRPDAIIAHGTGTLANDAMEDHVYRHFFDGRVPVTCTKWSVGHALGASGAVDIIAAAEALRRQELFAIGTTTAVDPALGGTYLGRGSSWTGRLERILVASAGFGGMHGAAVVARS